MGSIGSPTNSFAPYDNYGDCSQGICSIYCRQWCYLIFPPPPPFFPEDDSGTNFSPLIIAVIGILASAFLLVAYYTVVSKYCRRRQGRDHQNRLVESEHNQSQMHHDLSWQQGPSAGGLDRALIESITIFQYKRGDGLVEGTECAVCLGEFQEDEKLRLLPKCSHAFHPHCIDTWLKSHSSCPLCRANVIVSSNTNHPNLPPPAPPVVENSSNLNISSLEVRPQSDLVLVVDDSERGHTTETVDSSGDGFEKLRRSISLGSFPCRGNLLVSDILRISEEDEEVEMGIHRLTMGTGSSLGNEGFYLKRSISTGRFSYSMHEKGKNSVIPN